MKNLTTAIFAKATSSTFLNALNGRLFKQRAPDASDYPYAIFQIISDVPEKTFSEDMEDVVLQFRLFSDTSGSTEVENLYTYLRSLYDECSLSITGSTLVWCRRIFSAPFDEDHTTKTGVVHVFGYQADYSILTNRD